MVITQEELSKIKGRFNPWGEKHALFCDDREKSNKARGYFADNKLTKFEQYCFYLHELTDCKGIEFVVFSDSHFETVKLSDEIILFPCFLTTLDGISMNEPLAVATHVMNQKSRYVYDGWIPVEKWDPSSVKNTIKKIDMALSLFSLKTDTYFDWKPKYDKEIESGISHQFEHRHLEDIKSLMNNFDRLNPDDHEALFKSIGWLSQTLLLKAPEAKFIFHITALESLINYIEHSKPDSVFFKFKVDKISPSEKKKQRRFCFDKSLKNYETKPEESITEAYRCFQTGSRVTIQKYLEKVFGSNSDQVDFFFKSPANNRSLYDLRNEIVHGRHDTLNQQEREIIQNQIKDVEKITRQFILNVIKSCLGIQPFKEKTMSVRIPLEILSGSGGARHVGPVHMGIIYS